jgi:RNA polymerase sigma-70 factor (ECF subfamily)
LATNIEHIISLCKKQQPDAQKELYDHFKGKMFGVCMRYVKSSQEAEDIFIEGFYKVLTKINMYKGDGSFEGWVRRIMINESLMHLRKRNNLHLTVELPEKEIADVVEESDDDFSFEDIMTMLEELPVGYRTVFNLYVFEDYKHREIAEMLSISINTSKSQLILAKKRVLELVKKKEILTSKFKN